MPVTEFLILLLSMVGIFLWDRSESREDNRRLNEQMRESDRRINEQMQESNRRTENLIEAIKQDIKDFHGRLCSLEERYREVKR